ncbi:MAG: sulfatase-like hydrolase/transferase, partial [Sphaerochaetaceae bacterium]|nr:sulfatase-like hydrolase/transferase [Sphaerochaetaceae bacterium]
MEHKRQVVFIMTDTTRWDMIGCYGNKDMSTPNIDKLAEEGVRYNKAYSTQPVCGPARSAIFTGLYPHSNGGITNTVPLTSGIKTIGEYLKPNGIESAYIGKWHLDGGDYFGNGICPEGYDEDYWYDMRC